MPETLVAKMADMGFFGILVPEEYGGLGLGIFEYCLVAEELARAWMSVASIIARGNGLAAGFSREQREQLLPRVARGEMLGAFALSEPDAGSDIASIRCRAERRDDGTWLVNGQKMWCTYADRADFIILVARTTPYDPARRNAGIRNFFIPKSRGSFPKGITGNPIRKIGYHGWKTFELSITDLELPADALLGQERGGDREDANAGFKSVSKALSVARLHTAARSIGLARGALEDAIAYAQQRRQFDRPIGDFQAIRFKIADMAAQVEANRAFMYQIAADADAGRVVDTQASMAKYLSSEMSERVTSEALQIHGGAGYTTDFAVERYWRDARLTKIFEGTSEIQLRIVSDRYLPRAARG
jgi:alkylation response protein AidB-like acyl-CoA dehydrogenase